MGIDQNIFRARLLAWYDAHARDLPWRARPKTKKKQKPYHVWVSEIMLQQTRVAAVIEHYRGFLRRFPSVEKLAATREASVLAAWSGLGYYRRARMMHAAAKKIVRELDGKFPSTAEAWRELPGIGRYTAAAIASIAYDEPLAVVDGNVERVLQRVSGERLSGDELWEHAKAMLDRERPGDFNQAMMELGATVCTPRTPTCLMCPIVDLCATRGEMAAIATPARQKKQEIHYALVCRDSCRDSRARLSVRRPSCPAKTAGQGWRNPNSSGGCEAEVFLVQRAKEASLMAGMWELPEIPRPHDHAKPAFTVRHSITVTDYTVHVWGKSASDGGVGPPFSCSLREGGQNHKPGKWVALDTIPKLPLTGLARKILRKAAVWPVISKRT